MDHLTIVEKALAPAMTEREQEIVAYLDDLTQGAKELNAHTDPADHLMIAARNAQVEMLAAVRSFITEGAVRG